MEHAFDRKEIDSCSDMCAYNTACSKIVKSKIVVFFFFFLKTVEKRTDGDLHVVDGGCQR